MRHGGDHDARAAMLLGAMLAGQAFANSPVAAVHALAPHVTGLCGRSGAEGFIDEMAALSASLGLQQRLRDVGIPRDAGPMLAADAMKQQRLMAKNLIPMTLADATAIYPAAW